MKVERISVLEIMEGNIVAEDVLSGRGTLLVAKNTQINRYIKTRLLDMDVQDIYVYGQDKEDAFKGHYLENVKEVRGLLNDLAAGKGLDEIKLNKMSQSIYAEIHSSSNIVCLLEELMSMEEYTYTHSVNVAFYSALMAKWLKFPEKEVKMVVEAALLHDVGKIKVPPEILNKIGKLLPEEFEEMKKHTIYGYEVVRKLENVSIEVKNAVLMHHEREDMSGYPLKAGADDIHVYSKIIAIADVFDAMTTDRVYKKGVSPFEAFVMFQTIGQKSFDIKIVNSFLGNVAACYTGANVLTDTGAVGKLVYIPPHNISKPVIKVASGYLDLSRDQSLKILKIL